MNTLVAFIIMFGALFGLAYLTKRRFGVLGLALCAGSLLSTSWTTTLTPWIEGQGIQTVSPPLSAVVSTLLILLPPMLLLFSGPTYSSTLPRLAGSIAFALLAFTFLLGPVGIGLALDPIGYQIYNTFTQMSNAIIVAGIAAALGDILLTRMPRHSKKSSH
jgi:hypothetical protein